jgi:ketosteroid isomerase-like protein
MSRENVEVVQRALEHFSATGEVLWDLVDPEIEVHDHDAPDQGIYRGHAGFTRWLEDWGAAWADWSVEPQEFINAGESVVVVLRMKAEGRGSGINIDRQDAGVYAVRNGKVVRVDYYNNKRQALEAVGLRE